jgi:N-terminal acetyltransferase B complex catalytic subunit
MTTIRRCTMNDLLSFNNVNLDVLTETYNLSFYMSYMSQWPESFLMAQSPHSSQPMGYVLGKAEGYGPLWHGHVSAVTVAPSYRRLGLAATLMDLFETEVCSQQKCTYFVDLFVRASNSLAIQMYTQLGYVIYRRVLGYYNGDIPEDAYDMRKSLPRDVHKEAMIPLPHPVLPEDLEW